MKRYLALVAMLMFAVPVLADDGELFVKDISKTPDLDTNHATLCVLYKNVLARNSEGYLAPVTYTAKDDTTFDKDYVRPLIAMYHDGRVVNPEDSGEFPGHGQRDVFGAVSLDNGNTFLRTNLSKSGDKSSFTLKDHTTYYGDTFRLFANSAGTKVLAAWASRYANGGNPNYAMSDDDRDALAAYLGIDRTDAGFDLYLDDIWGVSGSQGSSDFADEGFPTVGEVPYATLWTCRGTLEDTDDDGDYDAVVWRQAERLTSGRRDVHRIEVGVAAGAGFVVTWQEDPDGLRPGEGVKHPRSVVANGGIYAWKDGRENWDTITAVFDYGPETDLKSGFQVTFASRMHNGEDQPTELYYSKGGEMNLDTNMVSSFGGLSERHAKAMNMQANLVTGNEPEEN